MVAGGGGEAGPAAVERGGRPPRLAAGPLAAARVAAAAGRPPGGAEDENLLEEAVQGLLHRPAAGPAVRPLQDQPPAQAAKAVAPPPPGASSRLGGRLRGPGGAVFPRVGPRSPAFCLPAAGTAAPSPGDPRELTAGDANPKMVSVRVVRLSADGERVKLLAALAVTSDRGWGGLEWEATAFRTSCRLSREALKSPRSSVSKGKAESLGLRDPFVFH